MNKMLFLLQMCVSPVILNGADNQAQVAANLAIVSNAKTVEGLNEELAKLRAKSHNDFARGMAVAGTVGAVAYYFLPKAKNRFHRGMGTIGAVAAGYGMNMYYDTLASFAVSFAQKNASFAQNNLKALGLAAVATGVIYHNYQYVKDTILGLQNSSLYKWLFDEVY